MCVCLCVSVSVCAYVHVCVCKESILFFLCYSAFKWFFFLKKGALFSPFKENHLKLYYVYLLSNYEKRAHFIGGWGGGGRTLLYSIGPGLECVCMYMHSRPLTQ